MTDNNENQPPAKMDQPADVGDWLGASAKNAQLNYGLMLASIVLGVTSIIAVIFAYMNRKEASDLVANHYQYQIRTFWISILYTLISFVMMFFVIGILLLFATFIWFIVRNVKGFLAVSKSQPIENPTTWWI